MYNKAHKPRSVLFIETAWLYKVFVKKRQAGYILSGGLRHDEGLRIRISKVPTRQNITSWRDARTGRARITLVHQAGVYLWYYGDLCDSICRILKMPFSSSQGVVAVEWCPGHSQSGKSTARSSRVSKNLGRSSLFLGTADLPSLLAIRRKGNPQR